MFAITEMAVCQSLRLFSGWAAQLIQTNDGWIDLVVVVVFRFSSR